MVVYTKPENLANDAYELLIPADSYRPKSVMRIMDYAARHGFTIHKMRYDAYLLVGDGGRYTVSLDDVGFTIEKTDNGAEVHVRGYQRGEIIYTSEFYFPVGGDVTIEFRQPEE